MASWGQDVRPDIQWRGNAGRKAPRPTFAFPSPDRVPAAAPEHHSDNDNLSVSPPSGYAGPRHDEIADELDCLSGVLAPALLDAAEQRGRALGVGADNVLIQWGVMSEETYLSYLAAHIGLDIEDFSKVVRADCPLRNDQLHFAARHGILPIRVAGDLIYIIAPRIHGARRTAQLIARYDDLAGRLRLAASDHFNEFLQRHCNNALGQSAAYGLMQQSPSLSAAPRTLPSGRGRGIRRFLLQRVAPVAAFTLAPLLVFDMASIVLAVWFLLFAVLRFAGSLAPRSKTVNQPRMADDQLPLYTVVAALYREASSVAALIRSIEALDYPREKLDIKIVLEPDDLQTRAAIARLGPLPHVQIIVAPDTGPRTKPKALNCALCFAQGTFITVFDAEDRPEPGQLRAALAAFTQNPDVACVQASLCIDNTADGWLPRMFTAEYAAQFDVFLQGFSRFRIPLPLGGSSNHFRTAVLRDVGGWDPYNVTEDADLGLRLARFGHRCVMFPSTTYEEAPARFGAWLKQRTRWTKGWMQTWGVHMRSPRQLWRNAGLAGFLTLNILVGGNVLTALAHPFLLADFLLRMAVMPGDPASSAFPRMLYVSAIVAGYLSTIAIGLIGLSRRGLLRESWILVLTPLYWICLSIAAWRALFQLLTDPYRWEKTEHGLARHSRIKTALAGADTRPVPMRGLRDSA